MLGVNNRYLGNHPVATKSVIRALLRAADICAAEPVRVARGVVERGVSEDYDAALATVRDIPFGKWREVSAEDTMRYYALRLYEAGMIKATPAKIIAKGTNWSFLNEVKRELAG
jgi:NitT/TauT family transport system substrate-binding protein